MPLATPRDPELFDGCDDSRCRLPRDTETTHPLTAGLTDVASDSSRNPSVFYPPTTTEDDTPALPPNSRVFYPSADIDMEVIQDVPETVQEPLAHGGKISEEVDDEDEDAFLAAEADLLSTKSKPPVPIRPPRRPRVCPPLPTSIPPPTPHRNFMPYPFISNPSAHCLYTIMRSLRSTYHERRKLEFTPMRLRWKELIGNSRLRVSVTADGEEGDLVPIEYRGLDEYATESEDGEESDAEDDSEDEYEYDEEDMAGHLGIVGVIRNEWPMGSINPQNDPEDDDSDDDIDLMSPRRNFWGRHWPSCFLKRARGPAPEDVAREFYDNNEDEEDEQAAMHLKKKQRTVGSYGGSDEVTPPASASQAEHSIHKINESDEPSAGHGYTDNGEERQSDAFLQEQYEREFFEAHPELRGEMLIETGAC